MLCAEKKVTIYAKDLKHIHPSHHKVIMKAALSHGENPQPAGYVKLAGLNNLFRIRVGPYSIIYTIQDDKLIVLVLEIGDRKDIYKHH